jgi:succinate dehydrogenase flavin-adding protein (antitoxin of CptAB toxin-antitoxin module)
MTDEQKKALNRISDSFMEHTNYKLTDEQKKALNRIADSFMEHTNYKLTDEQKRELDRIADSFMEHTNYKLTDEQINAAVAETMGTATLKERDEFACLNYCTDLNAMHEAEKTIFPYYATVYSNKLAKVTGAEMSDDTDYFCATARQRAEAFLRTLGKWPATDKESLTVQSTSSGGSGGVSTYGFKGLGIAGATWPPETRITVNGKTFCLADIDKEMTE